MGNKLIDTTINTIIPYGFITFWGFNYFFLNRRNKKIILFSSLFIFILQGIYYWHIFGYPQQVQIAKYPPRLYYLGYGVSVSFALLIICEKINLRIWDNKGVFFISKNSLWIYLWHILCIYLYEYFNFPNIWYLKFGVVALTSVVLVFVMNKVIDYVDKEKHIRIFKYLKG